MNSDVVRGTVAYNRERRRCRRLVVAKREIARLSPDRGILGAADHSQELSRSDAVCVII